MIQAINYRVEDKSIIQYSYDPYKIEQLIRIQKSNSLRTVPSLIEHDAPLIFDKNVVGEGFQKCSE